jgi:hypothetical protein
MPLISLLTSLDIIGTLQNDFVNWLNEIINGIIDIFLFILRGLGNIFLWSVQQVVGGILGFFGVPFSAWSRFVANNGGWFIPIIFVSILGITWLIAYGISIVYGFEKDIGRGEGIISTEEEKIEEEELLE